MLVYNRSLPDDPRDGMPLLVLLHGRGSHRGDLQALRPHIPPGWGLITPQAPHPGHPWNYGPGWAWYRYIEEDQVDAPSLQKSLAELTTFIDDLPTQLGFRPGRTVLGGFSQGGTMSLAWSLANPGRASGVLVFSGFLIASPPVLPTDGSVERVGVFWGHGTRDPSIPWALAERGRRKLVEAGVDLETKDYEIGHWIAPEEIADAMAFVAR
jgi:phospholipase/carboxylesterase